MKIRIKNSAAMGFVTNRDGEVEECELVGKEYRLTRKGLTHLAIRVEWTGSDPSKFAELVDDAADQMKALQAAWYNGGVPFTGPIPFILEFMGGPWHGKKINSTAQHGDCLHVPSSTGRAQYRVYTTVAPAQAQFEQVVP